MDRATQQPTFPAPLNEYGQREMGKKIVDWRIDKILVNGKEVTILYPASE